MWTIPGRRLVPAIPLLLFPAPSRADVAPESGLLAHIYDYEAPLITDCSEIIRSTPREGPVDFVLFFMRGAMGSGSLCLQSIHTVLTWPEAWQLLEWQPYYDYGGSGTLDPDGTTHALELSWDGYEIGATQGSVVPVARIRLNVIGPGRLDFTGAYGEAVLDCSAALVTHPVQVYAEAGMECGYISPHCAYYEWPCDVSFPVSQLVLRAAAGGAADSTILVRPNYYWPCQSLEIDTRAPWCTASIDSMYYDLAFFHVAVDADGLSPGTYATSVEVSNSNYGVSRCLPVEFIVEGTTATSTVSWGRVKSLYR